MEKQTWNDWFSSWTYVYWKGSTLVGAPILFCLLLVFMQKTLFTGTCALAGFQCQYGFGSVESIAGSVSKSLAPSEAKAEETVAKFDLESNSDLERFEKVLEAAKKGAKKNG